MINIIDKGLTFTSKLVTRKKTDKIILHHTVWPGATVEQIHRDAINNNVARYWVSFLCPV